ncbi:hypothetical protein EZJ49_02095 [Bdellovibrio bacteriovorus]|uniref:hypothetical protein n=1 Tax=Bdellovibrio bacteriovorus TaxID=959 RepID=UPI0021D0005F|nr:hypothetical protein [Bdellovibrio bacteriovorus]UXR65040.1 hypothetical protein EZJ49_02095 [Bdellovibrio bacteriovorus]
MRVINLENAQVETTAAESFEPSFSPVTHKSYHELADTPVVEKDALAQLHTNLEMLQDLQSRLAFVMREVRYLMKA